MNVTDPWQSQSIFFFLSKRNYILAQFIPNLCKTQLPLKKKKLKIRKLFFFCTYTLAKYNFHGKIHIWTHHSQVEMWWLWVELSFFTLGTAKYIFSCHSYNSYLCNRENIRPESGILILLIFCITVSLHSFCISKKGRFTCKLAGRVFKVLQKSDIGMFLFFFSFLQYTVQSFWQM